MLNQYSTEAVIWGGKPKIGMAHADDSSGAAR